MISPDDTDFDTVNGQRFDRQRIAACVALAYAMEALRLADLSELVDDAATLFNAVGMNAVELAAFSCGRLAPLDIGQEVNDLTFGRVLGALALYDRREAMQRDGRDPLGRDDADDDR